MCSAFAFNSCSRRSMSRSLWLICSRRASAVLGKLEDDCIGGSSNGFASRECVEAKGFCVISAEEKSQIEVKDERNNELTHDEYS
jgi:hypothetical protein